MRWAAGVMAAASGLYALHQWRDAEHVLTGVIAITAGVHLCLGALGAGREPAAAAARVAAPGGAPAQPRENCSAV